MRLGLFGAGAVVAFLSTAAVAERQTSCEPRDGGSVTDAAYCGAFDSNETACRMNSDTCYWSETSSSPEREYYCEAFDVNNAASRAYCRSFEETACRMNSDSCYWTWR
jgi:hypothetical protein